MGFNCGIVGLPNVGKSTLFNAITAAGAEASNYPFCTIEPNVGIVPVPDLRLDVLARIYKPARVVPTTIEFVDIAGLVKGASTGEGLGNQFLSHIRNVDAIAHVVRCFDDPDVVHVDGSVDPRRDIEVIETELILKDLETVERRLADSQKRGKAGDKKARAEVDVLSRIKDHLGMGRLARYLTIENPDEFTLMRDLHLLTRKPVMYVCNVNERDISRGNAYVEVVREVAAREDALVVTISASVEAEVAELPADERAEFLRGLGMEESGLSKVIHEGYALLHLITFFTAGPKEVRAWTVRSGLRAPEAAGTIHSDFEKGFIRAEVMRFDDLNGCGTEHAVRERGLLRIEGREYVVKDGDVMYVRFAV